jgi:hypothetical protein
VDEISDKEFKKMVIRTINECKDSTKTWMNSNINKQLKE